MSLDVDVIIAHAVLFGMIWSVLIASVSIVQHIIKWIDDDPSESYNFILKYMMLNWYNCEIVQIRSEYMYYNTDKSIRSIFGGYAYFMGLLAIMCVATIVILLQFAFIPSIIILVITSVIYLTRFVVRLSKRVNSLTGVD